VRRTFSSLVALLTLAVAGAVVAPPAGATTQDKVMVIYAKPVRAQFVDHNDDRERGDIRNPFNPDAPPTPKNANSAKKGARAGDTGLFSFKLYSDSRLTRPIGTAIYSCTFNFAQEAICEADFTLKGGTIIALGPAKLTSRGGANVVLPVIGGTGRYTGAHGQFTSRPSGVGNAHVVRFRLR
jgi:hypothetical protein